MSTIKVFCVLFAAVFCSACSLSFDLNEVFFLHGSRVLSDELDAGKLDAGETIEDAGETIEDAGATVDAGDVSDAGADSEPIECSGACLPAIEGWLGPMLVAIGAKPWEMPACPQGYESSEFGGIEPIAPPAECSPCACSGSQGGSCSPRSVTTPIIVSDNTCAAVLVGSFGGSWGSYPAGGFKDGTCAAFDVIGNPSIKRALYSNAAIGAWQSSPGACVASGGKSTVDPLSWGKLARACSPLIATAGACALGETCGSTEPGFSSCIARNGAHECPAGLNRHEVYGAANDSRSCSSCSCSAPTGEMCAWTFDAFEAENCQGLPIASLDVSPGFSPNVTAGACEPINPASIVRSVMANEKPNTSGSCAPSGGEPIGSVTPQDPVTICCLP